MKTLLVRHGYADPVPVAGDASARVYARVFRAGGSAILMRTTPEDAALFARRGNWLARTGLSAPAIIGADAPGGALLLEDFGDLTLARAMAAGEDVTPLYAAAGRALATLQRAPIDGLPEWDAAAMTRTAVASFCDWWWPDAMDGPPPRAAIEAALTAMLAPVAATRRAVHRDFFADNLMWLPERHGVRRIGILDFQDAAVGHPAYDMISLIEDARRDVPPSAREAALAAYRVAAPADEDFSAAMAVCAAQRHLRVAGLWVRLAVRDGRPNYLAHAPRTWALLRAALTHDACAPLAAVLAGIPKGAAARAAA